MTESQDSGMDILPSVCVPWFGQGANLCSVHMFPVLELSS